LRINDRKLLDAPMIGNQSDGTALRIQNEAFQAIIDETSKVDARAKNKPQDFVDRRYLDGYKKRFFDKLWSGK